MFNQNAFKLFLSFHFSSNVNLDEHIYLKDFNVLKLNRMCLFVEFEYHQNKFLANF